MISRPPLGCRTRVRGEGPGAFNSEAFRVYTSPDGYGATRAGALKNVIALAAGIATSGG